MSITGEPDGQPMKVGLAIIDVLAALNASIAILAALHVRSQIGKGQHLDIALLDSECACLTNQASNYLVGGMEPKRIGNANPNIVPYQAVKAKRRVVQHRRWQQPAVRSVVRRPRRTGIGGRPAVRDKSGQSQESRRNSSRCWRNGSTRAPPRSGCRSYAPRAFPADPISSIPQVFSDEQVLAREMVVEMPHPTAGSVKLVGSPSS